MLPENEMLAQIAKDARRLGFAWSGDIGDAFPVNGGAIWRVYNGIPGSGIAADFDPHSGELIRIEAHWFDSDAPAVEPSDRELIDFVGERLRAIGWKSEGTPTVTRENALWRISAANYSATVQVNAMGRLRLVGLSRL